jgi:hypothetical protein
LPHLKAYRGEFIDPLIAQHQSRILKTNASTADG